MRTKRRRQAIGGSTALIAAALWPLALPAPSAEAVAPSVVTFSVGNSLSDGGVPVSSGEDLGPNAVNLESGFLLYLNNEGKTDITIPLAPDDEYPTTFSTGLLAAAITGAPGDLGCSDAVLLPQQSCTIEIIFLPLASGSESATVRFGGGLNDFTFRLFGDAGYITGTSVATGAFFDTYGASIRSDAQPTYVNGVPQKLNEPIVGVAGDQTGGGYYLAAADGGVFTYGDATFHGSAGGIHLNKPIVGIAAHDTAPPATFTDGGVDGYWLAASDGGVFTYGNAHFYGSTGGMHLNKPIVGIAATADGGGYYLVAADGGVFTFGDARFYGSTGEMHLNQPIVGMAVTPEGGGYWLVAADGGIFSFGDAQFYGSTGGIHLNQPIVGMTATPDGGGYWLEARDAGSFTEGDAPYIQDGYTAPTLSTVGISAFGGNLAYELQGASVSSASVRGAGEGRSTLEPVLRPVLSWANVRHLLAG